MATPPTRFAFCVTPAQSGVRLDAAVAAEVPHCSRTYAATLIRDGHITVDGTVRKPGYPLKAGETVCGTIAPPVTPDCLPEAIPLDILYEDDHLLIVNKPPGMVVHPAPGHRQGTLVNALLHHCDDLAGISGTRRPGIVHRLDKDTSGALVVAKNTACLHRLAAQFKSRAVRKHYRALVYGIPKETDGSIDLPIGRHPVERKKMSVNTRSPRSALTLWRVVEAFSGACLLDLDIRTGRTHQIRVHCLTMGHPVIGDPVYASRGAAKQLRRTSAAMEGAASAAGRQMLHAWQLSFDHPVTGRPIRMTAPLPGDMAGLIERFRALSA